MPYETCIHTLETDVSSIVPSFPKVSFVPYFLNKKKILMLQKCIRLLMCLAVLCFSVSALAQTNYSDSTLAVIRVVKITSTHAPFNGMAVKLFNRYDSSAIINLHRNLGSYIVSTDPNAEINECTKVFAVYAPEYKMRLVTRYPTNELIIGDSLVTIIDLHQQNVGEFVPFQFTKTFENGATITWHIEFKFYIKRPARPTIGNNDSLIICADTANAITMRTSIPLRQGLIYRWEYTFPTSNEDTASPYYSAHCERAAGRINQGGGNAGGANGECYIPPQNPVRNYFEQYVVCRDIPPTTKKWNWYPLNIPVTSDTITFNPSTAIDFSQVGGLTSNRIVYFRVYATAITNTNGRDTSYYSLPASYIFSPPAPLIESLTKTPSCPNNNGSGSIHVLVDQIRTFRYMLNNGFDNTMTNCNPQVDNCFGFNVASGTIVNSRELNITNLPPGPYTLRLSNPGDSMGNCWHAYNVMIDSIPLLTLKVDSTVGVSCFAGTDGYIKLSRTGGNTLFPITFKIQHNVTGAIQTNTTGIFSNLPGGDYTVSVTDHCQQLRSATVNLYEPSRVTASLNVISATCNVPGNASITATSAGGSGFYDFYLIKNTTDTVRKLLSTTIAVWPVDNLTGGNYRLVIKDAVRPVCAGFDTGFVIGAPAAFAITHIRTDSVTCFGSGNGLIKITVTGGANNNYLYFGYRMPDSLPIFSTNGEFAALQPGNYRIGVASGVPGCTDSAFYSTLIPVYQPDSVQMSFTKTNVICKGDASGSITLTNISGGNGLRTYQWQKQLGPSYYDYSINGQGTGTSLTNLFGGVYRLNVTDQKGCINYSQDIAVLEADVALEFLNVQTRDIICFGSFGKIYPGVIGGYGGYKYYFRSLPATTYTLFDTTYNFPAGDYQVRVIDSLGCVRDFGDTIRFTAPPAALNFTTALSNFNGFSVSCFGNNNGTITVSATGGNGGNYTGYTYAIGNPPGAYQTSNVFSGQTAGTKTITVKDGRGCIITKTVALTQPTSQISVSTTMVRVNCIYDSTGVITATATGGVPPYQYRMTKSDSPGAWWETWQSSNTFNNLPQGLFTVFVRDQNGCTRTVLRSVTFLSAGPNIAISRTHVKCFNGSDGASQVTVTGGQNPSGTPYVYQWSNGATTSNVLNIPAGNYTVRVSDYLGCRKDSPVVITQPAELINTILVKPVCFNATNGIITVSGSGGTPPYTYSNNNGSTYQSGNVFNNVPQGSYSVVLKDNNNCRDTVNAVVSSVTTATFINFLVSSKHNAYDTLVVKEVCSPKPDSIRWVFDTAATIIDAYEFEPRIKFMRPGTYNIKMTAWFGGCDREMTKAIEVKPFDSTIVYTNTNLSGIDTVLLMPNPSNGQFALQVKLFRHQKLEVYIRNAQGALLYYRRWNGIKEIMEYVNLNNNGQLPPGIYYMKIITDNDARDKRLVVF